MRRFKMRLSLWAALGLVVTFGAVSHGVSASESNCNDNDGDSATAHLGALISTDSDSCVLVFSAQPGNALLSTNITSNGFNSSGAPVAVEVENDNGWPVTGVTVTLSLLPAGSSATLSGPLSSVSDSNGIATFGSSEFAAGDQSDRLLPVAGRRRSIPISGIERLPDHRHRSVVLIESLRNLDYRYVHIRLGDRSQRAER